MNAKTNNYNNIYFRMINNNSQNITTKQKTTS